MQQLLETGLQSGRQPWSTRSASTKSASWVVRPQSEHAHYCTLQANGVQFFSPH